MQYTHQNAAGRGSNLITTPVTAMSVNTAPIPFPEFLEVPRQGKLCPVTGLKRGILYQLIAEGKIESVVIRQRGKLRGKRLIVTHSILGYLHGLKSKQVTA